MKKINFILITLTVFVLSACGNGDPDNMIDEGNLTEGSWIGYNGDMRENEDMMTTDIISIDENAGYEINRSSYISFYNGEDFVDTVLVEDAPATLDVPEGADGVRISFNEYNADSITLKEEE